MRFPSCWSGRDFDPANPLAHMDFPINQDGLAGCREGFKVKRFPEIFVEYYLNTKSFNGLYGPNDIPWVLAQGDPGMDFIWILLVSSPLPSPPLPPLSLALTPFNPLEQQLNGWATGVLAKTMKTCNIGNTGDPLDSPQCFGAGSLRSSSETENSRVSPSVNEDVGLRGAYIYWSVYIYLDRSFQKFYHRRTPRTAEGLFESLSFSYTYPIQPPPPPPQFLFFSFSFLVYLLSSVLYVPRS